MRNAVIMPCHGVSPLLWQLVGIIGNILELPMGMPGAGVEFTGWHRPPGMIEGDSGIHSTNPLRAVDLRLVDVATREVLPDPMHREVCRFLNRDWEYDAEWPGKPVAYWHNKDTGWHIHLQVTRNTKRRTE